MAVEGRNSTTLEREGSESSSRSFPAIGAVTVGKNWKDRLQAVAMFSCSLYFIMPMVLCCWSLFIILLYTSRITAILMISYLGYVFLIDKSPINGTRVPYLRLLRPWWSYACDYLPLQLIKTANLDPEKKYVMGYHPHGIIAVGAFCAFATEGAKTLSLVEDNKSDSDQRGFSSLFPGIDRRIVTLPQNFATPFLREYFLSMGAVDSSKETFRSFLSRPSRALIVVAGGAAESMISRKHTMDLVLEHRRGFVREAILANACLVPVIGFGESDLYHVMDTDKLSGIARLQELVKRNTGVAMPLFRGRSLFFLDFGVMPIRTPVCVVVGAPIEPPALADHKAFRPDIDRNTDKPQNKDGEILIEWHEKYKVALKELYESYEDAHWNQPGRQRQSSIRIVK